MATFHMGRRSGFSVDRDSLHASDGYKRQIEALRQLQQDKPMSDLQRELDAANAQLRLMHRVLAAAVAVVCADDGVAKDGALDKLEAVLRDQGWITTATVPTTQGEAHGYHPCPQAPRAPRRFQLLAHSDGRWSGGLPPVSSRPARRPACRDAQFPPRLLAACHRRGPEHRAAPAAEYG